METLMEIEFVLVNEGTPHSLGKLIEWKPTTPTAYTLQVLLCSPLAGETN